MKWQGVIPAITTPFKPDLSVDADLLVKQVDALVRAGCTGIVALGSLGEGGSLSFDEKKAVLRLCKEALAGRASLVAGVAALTHGRGRAGWPSSGASRAPTGLMVLPPYVYKGDWRETRAHFAAVIAETPLPCMLYNNPIAYGTDVLPEQIVELARVAAQPRRGEGVERRRPPRDRAPRARGRPARDPRRRRRPDRRGHRGGRRGLDRRPRRRAARRVGPALRPGRAGKAAEARALYDWFLPLLRLDTVPKFVQLIKLVQAQTGLGSETVRPPRLPSPAPSARRRWRSSATPSRGGPPLELRRVSAPLGAGPRQG